MELLAVHLKGRKNILRVLKRIYVYKRGSKGDWRTLQDEKFLNLNPLLNVV
jgi:hypothetical protein